jgi:hypothetical protein
MEQTGNQQQQNGNRRVIPCYDELITFLKSWFAKSGPVLQKPVLELNRYSGISSKWQKVVEWKVATNARGKLKEISLICDNYTPLKVMVRIGLQSWEDKQLQSALTIPYDDLRLSPNLQVIVFCHSDGVTAINFDASIVGIEEMVG